MDTKCAVPAAAARGTSRVGENTKGPCPRKDSVMTKVVLEVREVGSGDVTMRVPYSEGVQSPASEQSLLAAARQIADSLRGPDQHSGSKWFLLETTVNGVRDDDASVGVVLTDAETLDAEGLAIRLLTERLGMQARKSK